MIHLAAERQVSTLHREGKLDNSVLEALIPSGRPHDFEGFQFDYKFFIRSDTSKTDDEHNLEIIRDISAFYNSMGGYLFFVFPHDNEISTESFVGNSDKLNQNLSSYIGRNIGVRVLRGNCTVEGIKRRYVVLYIPKRSRAEKPRSFVKNSKNIGTSDRPKFIIEKGIIYCRYEHECRPANQDVELLTYLFSERSIDGSVSLITKIENNLPPRDPNLIQFVGRKEYLESLWTWVSEPRRPIKVLTAAGGLGKTTVAYEFATQILDRPGAGFEKIVWLSGKKITFASLLGRLVSTTRCDFENIDELLDNFLLQVGSPESEIEAAASRDEKIVLCTQAFSSLSILLIVDDVDSLPRDEQNDLYAAISQIIISANVVNDNSRVLFTSRLELLTGQEQRIIMRGFTGVDYSDYLEVNISYLIDDDAQRKRIKDSKNKILDASAGSPIFITSIIRIVSLGQDLSKAVSDWRGKNGEQIRAFAFEREIDQLTTSQKEILYAMQLLSRARVDEIKEICDLTSVELEADLAALKDYHLYATKGDPAAGTVLEVPEPIRLMHDVTRGKIPDDRRRAIERACLSAKEQNEDPARHTAIAISQVVKLWKSYDYDVAEKYLTAEIQKHSKIGEFYCLRARTRMNIKSRKNEQIESDFEQAEKYGCNPFDLVKHWYMFKLKNEDWRGIARLHKRRGSSTENFAVFNCCYIMSIVRIADKSLAKKPDEALSYYKQALEASGNYINNGKAMGYFYHMRRLMDEASIGAINAIRASKDLQFKEVEVFRFVTQCLQYKLAPTHLLRTGLSDIERFLKMPGARATAIRQRGAILDDVEKIINYLNSQERVRGALVAAFTRLKNEVRSGNF